MAERFHEGANNSNLGALSAQYQRPPCPTPAVSTRPISTTGSGSSWSCNSQKVLRLLTAYSKKIGFLGKFCPFGVYRCFCVVLFCAVYSRYLAILKDKEIKKGERVQWHTG